MLLACVMACAREHEHISFVCAVRGRVTEAAVVRAHFGFAGRPQHSAQCVDCAEGGGGGLIKYAALACNAYNAIWVHSAETHTHAKSEEKERERDIVVTYLNDYYSVRIAYLLLRGHACSI